MIKWSMRFLKGIHHPHPPRGPARKAYRMSEAALSQRHRNLDKARAAGKVKVWRGRDESLITKHLIWQSVFGPEPKPSERALARELEVWPSYVHKIKRKALREGTPPDGKRFTLNDLYEARRMTARVREKESHLFARKEQSESSTAPAWISPEQQAEEKRQADVDAALERLEKRRETEILEKAKRTYWDGRTERHA